MIILNEYLELVKSAETLKELDTISEKAAFDETLTNSEYCNIYSEALKKAQSF